MRTAQINRQWDAREGHSSSPRLEWQPEWTLVPQINQHQLRCMHCCLAMREHINDRFCPEWRLRQLDGDR